MLMAAAALLDKTPQPSDAEIDAAMTNLCRCGTYQRVRAAIHRAAASMTNGVKNKTPKQTLLKTGGAK